MTKAGPLTICVNLPSLAFSSTVLATMFSSSIKKKKKEKKKKKILNAEVSRHTNVCGEYSVLQLCAMRFFFFTPGDYPSKMHSYQSRKG